MFFFYGFHTNRNNYSAKTYTEIVKPTNIKFEKIYSSNFYNVNIKIDRIIFEAEYEYENRKYQSKAILYWEFISPKLESILDNNEIEKLVVAS